MLRLIVMVTAAFFAAIVVGLLVLPFVISPERLRDDIARQISDGSGYDVVFGGDIGIRGLPSLAVSAETVTLTARDARMAVSSVSIGEIRAQLNVLKLLGGRAEFTEILLIEPVLAVRSPAGGGEGTPHATRPVDTAGLLDNLERLKIDRFGIERGRVELAGPGAVVEVEALDIALPSISSPASVDTSLRISDRAYSLAATVDTPRAALSGESVAVKGSVSAPAFLATPVDVTATFALSATALDIASFSLSGDDVSLSGGLNVNWQDGITTVRGLVEGERVVIGAAAADGEQAHPKAGSGASGSTPLDLAVLAAVDANIGFSLDALSVRGFAFAPAVGQVRTSGGYLDASLDLVGFAGGTVRGALALDPAGGMIDATGRLEADDLDISRIQTIVGLTVPTEGSLGATIDFATRGTSFASLTKQLNASGNVFLSRGSVSGLGLAGAIGDPAADRLEAVGLVAEFRSLDTPIDLRGGATWRGERFDISGQVDARTLAGGKAAPVSADIRSSRVSLGYAGVVAVGGKADGKVRIETPSLRTLMAWLNKPIGPGGGLEGFSFSGKLALSPNEVRFSDARITLDDSTGFGTGRVVLGSVPDIEATFDVGRLNLNPYLSSSAPEAGSPASGGNGGWSTAPIDFSSLQGVNGRLALSVDSLLYRDLSVGPVGLDVSLASGRMTADLSRIDLYGGTGLGQVMLDGAGPVPALSLRFDLANLNAGPFLADLAKFRRIDGRAAVAVDVSTAGTTQADMAAALAGQASFRISDGAIRGVNLARMMRSLSTDVLLGWQVNEAAATDFSELSASYQIANGQAANGDLSLLGPLVRVSGTGTVNLPAKTLDYRVSPKLVPALTGQGATGNEAGFGVPIRVSGPWVRPRIYPDIAGILENPEAGFRQLRSLGGGIFEALREPGDVDIEAPVSLIQDRIEAATGVGVGDIVRDGQVDTDAAIGAAVEGVGQLLGVNGQAPASDPGAPVSLDPNALPEQSRSPAPTGLDNAARDVLRGILGN